MNRKQEKRTPKKGKTWLPLIKQHISNHKREYCIVALLFLIGIVVGILFVNNMAQAEVSKTQEYLNNFITALKTDYQIDQGVLLKNSIVQYVLLAVLLWFMGSTVIGIPVVYAIVAIRGFSLGYTVSSIIATLGVGKGILFCVSTMLLQNIVAIPAILALAVSGIKLYQSIIKDNRRENIKLEICRHTIFSIFMLVLLLFSSVIEVYLSSNLLMWTVTMM